MRRSLSLPLFNPRVRSLPRANLLVGVSVLTALLLSHAPRLQPNLWILVPAAVVVMGMVDTLRNIQRRWTFYTAGVLLLLYMDLLAIFLVLFLLLYPYIDLGVHSF